MCRAAAASPLMLASSPAFTHTTPPARHTHPQGSPETELFIPQFPFSPGKISPRDSRGPGCILETSSLQGTGGFPLPRTHSAPPLPRTPLPREMLPSASTARFMVKDAAGMAAWPKPFADGAQGPAGCLSPLHPPRERMNASDRWAEPKERMATPRRLGREKARYPLPA